MEGHKDGRQPQHLQSTPSTPFTALWLLSSLSSLARFSEKVCKEIRAAAVAAAAATIVIVAVEIIPQDGLKSEGVKRPEGECVTWKDKGDAIYGVLHSLK